MSYGFCIKFHMLSSTAKNFDNGLRFDKVTESLKVGTFFETQCILGFNLATVFHTLGAMKIQNSR